MALLLLDLDHVKQVNDSLGHAAGDWLLTEAAGRLRTAAGSWLVARLGSDEFVVVMTGLATPAVAVYRARQLLDQVVAEPVSIDEVHVDVAATAGLAVAGDVADAAELLRRADVAMYQAKGVRARLRLGVYEKTRDRRGLGVAGAADRGFAADRVTVRYQPVVELATGRAVAAEALPQWRHPEFGDLAGGQALVVAQRSGLLAQVTDLVLEQALAAARLWRRGGFDLPVSVTLTPRMASDPRFPAVVLDQLHAAGVSPQRLVVELGQLETMGPVAPVRHSLAKLREAGVRVAFGELDVAQPPLSLVKSLLSADQIKVDCTGAGDVTLDPAALAVIGSMAELGRRLGAELVACGIARENQRQVLYGCGCLRGQGSMFAAARSAEDLLRQLSRGYDGQPGVLAPPLPDAEHPHTGARGHRLRKLGRGGLKH